MDLSQPECSAGGDRLSKLGDHVLGSILSFLPAKEAASAALLSSRWRHVFGAVHTVSLEEPEPPISDDDYGQYQCDSPSCHREHPPDPNAPPSFRSVVSAALIARHRRRGVVAPLRALRVAMGSYRGAADAAEVDQWISYALHQAAPHGLDLGLRLCHEDLLCCRTCYAMCRGTVELCQDPRTFGQTTSGIEEDSPKRRRISKSSVGSSQFSDDDSSVVSSSDDEDLPSSEERPVEPEPMYTVPRALFYCAQLRSLSLGFCRLAPPATVSLPSLVSLLLYNVPDTGANVERLIAGCPRLADLTLEACDEVTALTVLARLRRLALRCCHKLATVAVDASELRAFEYKGAVPDASSFLTTHGGCGRVDYCKVDICGAEATSEEELINLMRLLHLFVNAKHLHLESARLGSGLDKDVLHMKIPCFLSLRHLEMRGCLPDNETGAVGAMSRILEHAPNLEVISLAFHPQEHDSEVYMPREEKLLDAHHLSYSPHSVLAAAATSAMIPCCLRSRVREINLVHYQGGTAQRALAKFLLCNAPAVDKLWCEFAEGAMFEQIQLTREIKGWLINKAVDTHFA